MMDIKQIKADTASATQGLTENARAQVISLVQQAQALTARLAPIDQESRQLSKKIGQAKKQGEDATALLQQKKTLSAEVDTIQQQIDVLDQAILACFAPAPTPAVDHDAVAAEPGRYRWQQMRAITVHELDAAHAPQWDAYVNANPAASAYHLSCWQQIIGEAFGHPSVYLYARDDAGNVCGVLPMVRLTSRVFGDFVVSIPFFNYGGPLGEHADVEAALLAHAAERAAAMGVKHVEFRDDVPREHWPVREDKVAMLRALPDSPEALWQELGTKLRAQIKKPQKENPSVSIGGIELLDDFYEVFAINMRDLGTPVYAKEFFAVILRRLPDMAKIVVVRHQGRPVSTAFLLGYRQMMEIPWASTIREANQLSMNMLLYWEVLSYCIRQGYRCFDFGRSTVGAGTYKFKEQWGAQPKQLYWHYWLPTGQALPKLNPDNPKFKLAIAVWQQLPVWLTKLMGPMVVKYLP